MNRETRDESPQAPDIWSLMTWVGTAVLAYLILSGALIYWIDFSVYAQYSVIMHTAVGAVALAPTCWLIWKHWRRRDGTIDGAPATIARLSLPLLVLVLASGAVITLQAAFGTYVSAFALFTHQATAALFALVFLAHIVPVLLRFAGPNPTPRRIARPRFVLIGLLVLVAPVAATHWLSANDKPSPSFRALPDDYVLSNDADSPFGPSRAQLAGATAGAPALDPAAVPESATCGNAGCHSAIFDEWLPSAHGYAARDTLFVSVQELLAEHQGAAETRLCAGCHDPIALLSGTRDGASIAGDRLVVHEGVSCVSCHAISSTDTLGNGSYTFEVPDEYLYARATGKLDSFLHGFLVRSYPWNHRATYGRDILGSSEYCASCHKQTPAPGDSTGIGIAQEQNEYDSWRNGHWYDEDDPDATLHCQDCHMPLVASDEPATGGSHRSHRYLGSNMYMPVALGVPGGSEQAALTASWLRGEISIPEIADRWADGPVVTIDIVAPEQVDAGELINLTLVLHNNKTGHDFPAGPLDILASWVELEVVDNLGRTVLHLGSPDGDAPTVDAPIVYKADWYDKRGLPVDRHEIWDAVGSSFKHALQSGDAEIVDIPFRCPAVARPRISDSVSEQGPGERKSDVVMSIDNDAVTALTVTARLIYRKVTPEFLKRTLEVDPGIDVPTLVLSESMHTIRVNAD